MKIDFTDVVARLAGAACPVCLRVSGHARDCQFFVEIPRTPPRLADRLLDDHLKAVRDVKLCYDCGDDVTELNAWARLDSTWNALQVARGRVEPLFLRRQAE